MCGGRTTRRNTTGAALAPRPRAELEAPFPELSTRRPSWLAGTGRCVSRSMPPPVAILHCVPDFDEEAALLAVAAEPRLNRTWHLVQSRGVAALSLDVFDTVLWRAVPEPVQAFFLLGCRLQERRLLPLDVTPEGFASMRVVAERRARDAAWRDRDSHECRLEEIYGELARVCTADTNARYVEEEVALEYEILRPDLAVVALMELVGRSLGKPVRLVSDTYFSAAQVRRLLLRPELEGIRLDDVAVSSEYGVGKADGLFAVSLSASGLAPSSVVHVGDNSEADVRGARAAGLRAVHYEKGSEELTAVLTSEGVLGVPLGDERSVDRHLGDHGLTALRARVVRRTEADQVPVVLREHWLAGAAVFGPAFAGFASWVHERAAAAGAEKVLCLMREGEFLDELVNAAGVAADVAVPSEPLWLSRQVCALAAVFTGSTEELRSFLGRRKPTTVAGLFAQVGADLWLAPQLDDLSGSPLDAPDVLERVLEVLNNEPQVRAQVVLRAQQVRERLYRHLDRQLPAGGPVVVVDIGWGATIQTLLARLLEARGTPREVVGLYLATQTHAELRRLEGLRAEGYLASGGRPEGALRAVLRSPEILEQICMSDNGTLVGLDADARPVTAPERMPRLQVAQKLAVQQGIAAFQDLWLTYRRGAPVLLGLSSDHARRMLLASLARLHAQPTPEEALAFGSWAHDENFGATNSDLLVDEQTLERARYLSAAGLAALSMRDAYWPAGAARLANPALAAVHAGTLAGTLLAEDVSPRSEIGGFEIYVDEGEDFHLGPKVEVPVLLSPQGRALVRARLETKRVRRVRVDPPGRRSLLRVDWLRLRLHSTASAEPFAVVLRTLQEAGVALVGLRWVGPGLLEVVDDDPMIGYDLGIDHHELMDSVHAVDVEVAFSCMHLPAGLALPEPTPPPPPAPPPSVAPLWRRSARGVLRQARHLADLVEGVPVSA